MLKKKSHILGKPLYAETHLIKKKHCSFHVIKTEQIMNKWKHSKSIKLV